MKTAMLLLLLLLVPALQADEMGVYHVSEGVSVPDPQGIPILSWGVNGPTIGGDSFVVGQMGFLSIPGSESDLLSYEPGVGWLYAGFVDNTTLPVGYSMTAVVNLPAEAPSSVAPEPGTLLLLGSGLVALGLLPRRASRSRLGDSNPMHMKGGL